MMQNLLCYITDRQNNYTSQWELNAATKDYKNEVYIDAIDHSELYRYVFLFYVNP